MSEPIRGVIVAHGDLAGSLRSTVERIAGLPGGLAAVSNESVGPEELRRRLEVATSPGPAIIFTDLASGSCTLAARLVARQAGEVAVVTGANLPMLLDFVFHREMELPALVDRLVRKGRSEIRADVPTVEPSSADHPVSH